MYVLYGRGAQLLTVCTVQVVNLFFQLWSFVYLLKWLARPTVMQVFSKEYEYDTLCF